MAGNQKQHSFTFAITRGKLHILGQGWESWESREDSDCIIAFECIILKFFEAKESS